MIRHRKRDILLKSDLFNIWVIGGVVVLASLLMLVSVILLWATRPGPDIPAPATAIFDVISAPTATRPVNTSAVLTPTDTSQIPAPPGQGVILVGAYVQVSGTGGEGLRLRNEPGLSKDVRLLGSEAEVFRVEEGPVEVDGYTWWRLVGPFDQTRQGWAVSNYLVVVQNP